MAKFDAWSKLQKWRREMLFSLARQAFLAAQPIVAQSSQHLANHMSYGLTVDTQGAYVRIPHYWAIFVHDNTRPFGPRFKRFLVWFPNPEDDPRLKPEPPINPGDVKSLYQVWTRDQWEEALRKNDRRRKAGQVPFMVLAFHHAARRGKFFFSEGMKSFEETADSMISDDFAKVMEAIGDSLSFTKVTTIKIT